MQAATTDDIISSPLFRNNNIQFIALVNSTLKQRGRLRLDEIAELGKTLQIGKNEVGRLLNRLFELQQIDKDSEYYFVRELSLETRSTPNDDAAAKKEILNWIENNWDGEYTLSNKRLYKFIRDKYGFQPNKSRQILNHLEKTNGVVRSGRWVEKIQNAPPKGTPPQQTSTFTTNPIEETIAYLCDLSQACMTTYCETKDITHLKLTIATLQQIESMNTFAEHLS